jgi:pimeloyl-ACP methyl ester carboxylesterase
MHERQIKPREGIWRRLRRALKRAACLAALVALPEGVFAYDDAPAEPPASNANTDEQPERNVMMKTLGGRQFWGDVLYFRGWRVQQSVLTHRYRLLDPDDYRHAAGTLDECRQKLAEIKKERKLAPMSGKAVVAIHGIIRSSKSFAKMRGRLTDAGYEVVGFDYPSTRVEISDSAEYLHSVLESLEGIEEIHIVVHSMGGLVVRSYLSKHRDPRIKRMVMIGVPNLGADMADRLRENPLYRAIFGPAGQQLVTDPAGFIARLPTPDFEFAVIAGSRGSMDGYNPLIPGDDDGTVGVSSTRLAGAADFATVRGLHAFLMANDESIDQTLRFLQEGRLRAEGQPHPIPKSDKRNEAGAPSDVGGKNSDKNSGTNGAPPNAPPSSKSQPDGAATP